MNVTRDVILDLLPLYLAGEASAATSTLVDEYLATDPELAAHVRRERALDSSPRIRPEPDAALEVRALYRAQRAVGLQRWLFGLTWFFGAISLTSQMTVSRTGIRNFHFLIFEYPQLFGSTLLVAAGCLTGYLALRRRAAAGV